MKKKVIDLIKILGVGINELIIDISFDDITFNSIEWCEEDDKLLLHLFENNLDYFFDFDKLKKEQQEIIYKELSILYN